MSSTDVDVSSGGIRAKGGQAAKNGQSWIVNATEAPVDLGKGTLYVAKKTWDTKGAWPIGFACMLCGVPIVFGAFFNFGIGALTAGSSRSLPEDADTFTKVGRTTAQAGGAFVGVFVTGVSEGVAATQVDNRERYDGPPSRLTRTRQVNYRRPDAYRRR